MGKQAERGRGQCRVSLGLRGWGPQGFDCGWVRPRLRRQAGPSCIYPHVHTPLTQGPGGRTTLLSALPSLPSSPEVSTVLSRLGESESPAENVAVGEWGHRPRTLQAHDASDCLT